MEGATLGRSGDEGNSPGLGGGAEHHRLDSVDVPDRHREIADPVAIEALDPFDDDAALGFGGQ